jgi:C1A family cysteine protease
MSNVIGINTIQKTNKLQILEIIVNDRFNSQNFGLGYIPLSDSIQSDPIEEYYGDPPSQFDWRNYNDQDWTTTARNQGSCGSCWDFAAHSCLEAMVNIIEGDSNLDLDLSEQYILSCYSGGWGCGGSNAYYAYGYMFNNGGAIPESCFTYSANDVIPCSSKCTDWQDKLVPITDYGYSSSPTINNIKNKIVNDGPVCVSFSVYSDFYDGSPSFDSSGVYQHKSGSYRGGHQVAAVGYVDTPSHLEYEGYWICKNSWGANWGPWDDGCFGIAYGEVGIDEDIVWVEYSSTAPDTSIITGPSGIITYNDITFEWIGSDGNTPVGDLLYSYILEGYDSQWSTWDSFTSESYYNLPNAEYTFKVKAKDKVEIPDYSPATQSFTIEVPLYDLTININGQGSVIKNPDKPTYPEYMTVELTAITQYGWVFDHWEGDLTGSNNPETITMNSDKTITAYFTELPQYSLNIIYNGKGTITKNPDYTTYPEGETVELTAIPDPGWVFDHWEGDHTGISNPDTITMNSEKTIIGVFNQVYQLDQQQEKSGNIYLIYNSRWLSQSFTPTYDKLSNIELLLGKYGSPPNDVVVSIRSSLTGSDLTSVVLSPNSIPDEEDWIEFDFNDIVVTPGNTYYIVVHTSSGSTSNCYIWSFGFSTPYTNGVFHLSFNNGIFWLPFTLYDFCFRTFAPVTGPPVPLLTYNPMSCNFGSMLEGETDSTVFEIWNSGAGTLTYSLSEDCSWVELSSTGGDSTGV